MLDAGLVLGACYGIVTLIAIGPSNDQLRIAAFFAAIPVGLAVLATAFSDEAQVNWYAKLLFVPWVSGLGVLVAVVLGMNVLRAWAETRFVADYLFLAALLVIIVLPFSTLIWLVRALDLLHDRLARRAWSSARPHR